MSHNDAPSHSDIRDAAERIAPYVRRTPLLSCAPCREFSRIAESLTLKLECLQVTGSFKPRGAINKLKTLPPEHLKHGLVTASGGNHGLGVAYAGTVAKLPTTVFVPIGTPTAKIDKLKKWEAGVIVEGEAWDDSNRSALTAAQRDGLAYFHAFADPAIIAGQGTVALEILDEAPRTDTLVVAIGGGGLISGISIAAKAINPNIRIIGVEPVGAATLYRSVEAGRLVELERIDTAAATLGARASEQINFDLVRRHVAEIVLVTDDDMRAAARWLWFELGVAAELSGAAAVAGVLSGQCPIGPGERVCALVCGAGTDGMS
ncbi:MAG: threonine/serine dehydratase [Candidatus Binataceae bacterium]